MKLCVNFCFILLVAGTRYPGNEASVDTEPECPDIDDTCANLALDWDDLLEPGFECPASNYVDLIDPTICDHMDDLFLPPPANVTFTSVPQDQEVSIGGSAEFSCVSDPAAFYIHWYFQGRRITDKDNPYSSVMNIFGGTKNMESETKLRVEPVGEEFYGEYMCVVMTSNGVAQASAWLSKPAVGSPESCSIEFSQEPQNRLVKVGEYVKLNCVARASDVMNVTWYKTTDDGAITEITADSDEEVMQTGLIIPAATPEHNTTYTCVVCSDTCRIESSATVTVYSKLSEECGTNPHNGAALENIFAPQDSDGAKILHGTDVELGSIPWQVSLQHRRAAHICGGVVVDRYWILTAAHCFILGFKDDYRRGDVRFHQHNIILRFGIGELYKVHDNKNLYNLHSKDEQVRRIRYYVVHPGFQRRSLNYDFALVKLTRPLEFNDHVRPICLPERNDDLFVEKSRPGNSGVVSGWGSGSSSNLQGAKLPIQTEATCSQNNSRLVTGAMFCAGAGTAGSPDACKGDSGGPFAIPLTKEVTKWYLAGLVSWGPKCSNRDPNLQYQPGFYANVSVVVPWILQKIGLQLY